MREPDAEGPHNGAAAPAGAAANKTPRMRLRMLSDATLDDDRRDLFGYGVYADAVADLISREGVDTPLTIAISGPWGAGKTSLAKMIVDRLHAREQPGDRENLICWFNAWMHDDAPTSARPWRLRWQEPPGEADPGGDLWSSRSPRPW